MSCFAKEFNIIRDNGKTPNKCSIRRRRVTHKRYVYVFEEAGIDKIDLATTSFLALRSIEFNEIYMVLGFRTVSQFQSEKSLLRAMPLLPRQPRLSKLRSNYVRTHGQFSAAHRTPAVSSLPKRNMTALNETTGPFPWINVPTNAVSSPAIPLCTLKPSFSRKSDSNCADLYSSNANSGFSCNLREIFLNSMSYF